MSNRLPKGTPAQWVDKLLEVGPDDWCPPILRAPVPLAYSAYVSKTEWADAYRELLNHHELETDVLSAVIRELVERLKKSQT